MVRFCICCRHIGIAVVIGALVVDVVIVGVVVLIVGSFYVDCGVPAPFAIELACGSCFCLSFRGLSCCLFGFGFVRTMLQ